MLKTGLFYRRQKFPTSCICLWLKSRHASRSAWLTLSHAALTNFWHLRSSISHHTGKLTSSLAPSQLEKSSPAFSRSRPNTTVLLNVTGTRGPVWNPDLWRKECIHLKWINRILLSSSHWQCIWRPWLSISGPLMLMLACPSLSKVIDSIVGCFRYMNVESLECLILCKFHWRVEKLEQAVTSRPAQWLRSLSI